MILPERGSPVRSHRAAVSATAATLLYVVNIPRFFVSHRLALALAAKAHGYDVHIATSDYDQDSARIIRESNLPLHPISLSQHGVNPLTELRTLAALHRLYSDLQPDLIHHISIKPVLYGGLAAHVTARAAVVHAMSGLGYVFVSKGIKASLLRLLTRPLFRVAAAGKGRRMIFQNPDDLQRFVASGLIAPNKAVLIRGSGVDETRFLQKPEPDDVLPVVLFAGRLLWQKGLGDFVEVARRLRGQAQFRVVGYEEVTSPLNVPVSQLQAWADEGLIQWSGKSDDMPEVYAESNIVCLPSTYGEGVPKVLIEAASCGRACVTTDTPGCREIVRHQVNGLLVPPGEIDALTKAVHQLIESPSLRAEMGAKGREIVLAEFTLGRVVQDTLALYQSLLEGAATRS